VQLDELGKLEKFNDLIGTRTRDLPARGIEPQPSTLPCWIENWDFDRDGLHINQRGVRRLRVCGFSSG
jgi:hypothetical protein